MANSVLTLGDLSTPRRELARLHRLCGHPPGLFYLLRHAGQGTRQIVDLLREIAACCHVCLSTGQPAPRPRMCLPLLDLNGIVALDIFYADNIPISHIIDVATHFSRKLFYERVAASQILSLQSK